MEGGGGSHPAQYPGYSSCGQSWNNNLPPQHVQNSYSLAAHGQPSPLPPGGPQGGPGSAPVPSPLYPWMRSQFGKFDSALSQWDPPSHSDYSELETGADCVQGWDSSSDSGYHDIGRTASCHQKQNIFRKIFLKENLNPSTHCLLLQSGSEAGRLTLGTKHSSWRRSSTSTDISLGVGG